MDSIPATQPFPRIRSWSSDPEILASLGLACLYFAVMSGHPHSIDGLLMYRQAQSIAYNHSLHFATPLLWGGTFTTSKYGIGLSLLYLPGLLLWSWLSPYVPSSGSNPYNWALFYQDPLYTAACAPVHVLIVAASAYLVARFIRHLGFNHRIALWGLALYGIASPALVYARGDWAQSLAGLCWIAGLYFATRSRRAAGSVDVWLCGASVSYAVLTRPVEGSMLLVAVVALMVPHFRFWLWSRSSWYPILVVAASYLLGVAITLLVNWGRYGSPFTTGYEGEGWTTPPWLGLAGALVSPGRGILLEFPAAVLFPLGIRQLWRTEHRKIALVLLGLIGFELLNVSMWYTWWGGWNWGLRLFVPALPLVAILAAIGIDRLPHTLRFWLPLALMAAGVVWVAPCVVTDLLYAYGGTYSSTSASFQWSAYPPIGAWQYFHHWRAIATVDSNSADVLWLHMARTTGNASLVWPAFLIISAVIFASRVRMRVRLLLDLPLESRASSEQRFNHAIAPVGPPEDAGQKRGQAPTSSGDPEGSIANSGSKMRRQRGRTSRKPRRW
jgi:hypothetical protein